MIFSGFNMEVEVLGGISKTVKPPKKFRKNGKAAYEFGKKL